MKATTDQVTALRTGKECEEGYRIQPMLPMTFGPGVALDARFYHLLQDDDKIVTVVRVEARFGRTRTTTTVDLDIADAVHWDLCSKI